MDYWSAWRLMLDILNGFGDLHCIFSFPRADYSEQKKGCNVSMFLICTLIAPEVIMIEI